MVGFQFGSRLRIRSEFHNLKSFTLSKKFLPNNTKVIIYLSTWNSYLPISGLTKKWNIYHWTCSYCSSKYFLRLTNFPSTFPFRLNILQHMYLYKKKAFGAKLGMIYYLVILAKTMRRLRAHIVMMRIRLRYFSIQNLMYIPMSCDF